MAEQWLYAALTKFVVHKPTTRRSVKDCIQRSIDDVRRTATHIIHRYTLHVLILKKSRYVTSLWVAGGVGIGPGPRPTVLRLLLQWT